MLLMVLFLCAENFNIFLSSSGFYVTLKKAITQATLKALPCFFPSTFMILLFLNLVLIHPQCILLL